MRTSFPPLSCLLAFEAASRRLSFAAAATELHLTPSAVSHQIAKLEQFLGARLFDRTARTVALTEVGRDYRSRVSEALGALSFATDSVRRGARNALHVHTSPSFGSLWLMPRLACFAKAHPAVALSLSSSVSHSDFANEQIDIDIRYGVAAWPHLHVQPVFDEDVQPLASAEFIAAHRIETPEDLLHVPLIQSAINVVQWCDWFRHQGIDYRPQQYPYRFDRTSMALDAAVQGLGVAFDSAAIAGEHLRQGRLHRVFDEALSIKVQAHFLVCPLQHLQRPEVADFIAWIGTSAAEFACRERRPVLRSAAAQPPTVAHVAAQLQAA